MPTLSFAEVEQDDNTAAPLPVATTQTAPKAELAAATSGGGATTGLDGDFNQKDIKLPRLNLVQKTSEAVDAGVARPGDILFKSGDALLPLSRPTEITILHLDKKYQEDVPYGSGVQAKIFNTAAEVRENGGSTEWGAENRYKEMANVQILFPAPADTPEEMLDLFPYEFEGQSYAVAMMTLTGSAYTNAAKPIITAFMTRLRGKHWTGKWTLDSEKKTGGGNSWYAPKVSSLGLHDEAFAEFAQGFLP